MRRAMVLLLALVVLSVPASAVLLPCDADSDGHLTDEELSQAILGYLTGSGYLQQDLRDAAFVHACWDGQPLTFTDSSGKEHTLYRPLRRIAVLNSETVETLRTLQVGPEAVVGIDTYTRDKPGFFAEYTSTPVIGSVFSPDYEKIVSLRPDAVFLYATVMKASGDEIAQRLSASMPETAVIRLDCYLPDTYPGEIEILGRITGKNDEAERFIDFYSSQLKTVATRVNAIPEDERVKVYFETWNDYKTAAEGSGYHDKIVAAGGTNIFGSESASYPQVDPEAVIFRNPDIVIKLIGGGSLKFGGYIDTDRSKASGVHVALLTRPGWNAIPAVRNDRVYLIHSDIVGGPQQFIGITYLARWFYPDRFADIDPDDMHHRYLTEFQHRDGNLSGSGTFSYPSIAG